MTSSTPLDSSAYAELSDMLAGAFTEKAAVQWLIKRLLAGPARELTAHTAHFDQLSGGENGPQRASQWLFEMWDVPVKAKGLAQVPPDGPLLVTANHAGLGDAMAFWSVFPRQDVQTVVRLQGLLKAVPNLHPTLIAIEDDQPNFTALRRMIATLSAGETLLLFPRGEMEYDPRQSLDVALESLHHWHDSVGLLARRVPEAIILPVVISGMLSPKAWRHPAARLYRDPERRQFVASTLQLALRIFEGAQIEVNIGAPFAAADYDREDLRERMAGLMRETGQGS